MHVLRGGADDVNFGPDITGDAGSKAHLGTGSTGHHNCRPGRPRQPSIGAEIPTRALQNGLLTGTRREGLAEEVLPSSQGRRRTPGAGHRSDSPRLRRHGGTGLRTGTDAGMYSGGEVHESSRCRPGRSIGWRLRRNGQRSEHPVMRAASMCPSSRTATRSGHESRGSSANTRPSRRLRWRNLTRIVMGDGPSLSLVPHSRGSAPWKSCYGTWATF